LRGSGRDGGERDKEHGSELHVPFFFFFRTVYCLFIAKMNVAG